MYTQAYVLICAYTSLGIMELNLAPCVHPCASADSSWGYTCFPVHAYALWMCAWTCEFICPGASEGHTFLYHIPAWECLGTHMFMNMYACMPEWGNVLVPERVSVNTHIHASKRTQLWKAHMSCVQMWVHIWECASSTFMVCGHTATSADLQKLCSVCMAGSIRMSAPCAQPGTCLKVHMCLLCTLAWVCGHACAPPCTHWSVNPLLLPSEGWQGYIFQRLSGQWQSWSERTGWQEVSGAADSWPRGGRSWRPADRCSSQLPPMTAAGSLSCLKQEVGG